DEVPRRAARREVNRLESRQHFELTANSSQIPVVDFFCDVGLFVAGGGESGFQAGPAGLVPAHQRRRNVQVAPPAEMALAHERDRDAPDTAAEVAGPEHDAGAVVEIVAGATAA